MGGKLAKLLKELDLSKGMAPPTVDLIFTEFDKENRGYLTKHEVHQFVSGWCTVHHSQDVDSTTEAFMRRFDVNADGKITKHMLVSGGVARLSKTPREWNDVLRHQLASALRAGDKAVAQLLLDGVSSVQISPQLISSQSSRSLALAADPNQCGLDTRMAQTLREAMDGNSSVKLFHVVVTDELGLDGAMALSKLLQSSSITTLSLSFRETRAKCVRGWTAFAKLLETSATLTDVTWGEDINLELSEALAESLSKASPSLRTFALRNCKLDPAQGVAVVTKMLKSATVSSFEFDHVELGDAGATTLAQSLAENPRLKSVSCKTAAIGPAGAAAFAKLLDGNPYLESVDLVGNMLGEQGIAALATAIAHNRKLSRLKLGWGIHFQPLGRSMQTLRGAIEIQLLERNGLLSKEETKTPSEGASVYSSQPTTFVTFVDLLNVEKPIAIGGVRSYPSQQALLMDCLRTTTDFEAIDALLKKNLLTSQMLTNRKMTPQETEKRKKSLLSRMIDGINRLGTGVAEESMEIAVFRQILERFPEIFDGQFEDHNGQKCLFFSSICTRMCRLLRAVESREKTHLGIAYAASCGPILVHILETRNRTTRGEKAVATAEKSALVATQAAEAARLHAACACASAAAVGACVSALQADDAVAQAGWFVSATAKSAYLARAEADRQFVERKAFAANALLFY